MKLSNILCSLILCITCTTLATAEEVYKWVDENGVSHYGDEARTMKQHGAKPVNVATPKSIGSVNVSASNYTPKAQNIRNNNNALSPSNNQEVRANNGTITVVTGITPRPQGDYSLKVFIDGSLMASSNNSTRVDVTAVPRGEHNVMVKMICKNGSVSASTNVHFTVMRVAVGK